MSSAMANEAVRLREFIRTLEWSGSIVIDYDDITADACPSCGGIRPAEIERKEAHGWGPEYFGHKLDCKLVAILKVSGD